MLQLVRKDTSLGWAVHACSAAGPSSLSSLVLSVQVLGWLEWTHLSVQVICSAAQLT